MKFPTVNSVALLKRIVANAAGTGRPTLIVGFPGIGKTAILSQIARDLNLPLYCADLGNGAREDNVMPIVINGDLVQVPLNAIKACCVAPGLLFLDEITRCDKSKQAVAMTIANERRIGSYNLHPGTVVVMAGNPLESAGTYALNDALVNRCGCYFFRPSRDDSRNFLASIGAPGSTLNKIASKYSAICGMRPEMLVIEMDEESGGLAPTPRAVHHALERMAHDLDHGGSLDQGMAIEISGVIGESAAAAWFAVLAHEDKIPTPEAVCADPLKANVPPDLESAVAALGMLALAVKIDPNATWTYVGRYANAFPDAAGIVAKSLLATGRTPTQPDALKVFGALCGKGALAGQRARG